MAPELDTRILNLRRLQEEDAETGFHLSSIAGWNQTRDDWRLLLKRGQGLGFAAPSGELVATGILLPYEFEVGWIGMVLVHPSWRRRGVATRLMRLLVELGPEATLALDATEMGRSLYESLGFEPLTTVYRLRRSESRRETTSAAGSSDTAEISRERFLKGLQRFGKELMHDRLELIAATGSLPGATRYSLVDGQKDRALTVVRRGLRASQIGPILAADEEAACKLLSDVSLRHSGELLTDIDTRRTVVTEQAHKLGFSSERSFVRMYRGARPEPRQLTYAIAGPEYG